MPRNRATSHGLEWLADRLQRAGSEPEMRDLLCHLPDVMASSVADTPVRTRPYPLGPSRKRLRRGLDSAWLSALWSEYRPSRSLAVPQRVLQPVAGVAGDAR